MTTRRLLRHGRACRWFLALSVLVGLGTAGCVLGQAVVLASAITGVFLGGAGPAEIGGHLAALAGLVVARALLAHVQETIAARASAAAKSQLRTALVHRVVALGPGRLPGRRTGELAQLATRGLDALDPYFARYLPQLVLAAVVTPLFVVSIWLADWLSGLVVLLTLPVVPMFMVLVGVTTQRHTRRQWRTLARLSHHFLDVVDGLTTLRVFGRARAQQQSLAAVTDDYRTATMGVLRLAFLSAFVLELATSLAVALVAVQIGLRLVGGSVGLEAALLVLLLAPETYLPLRQVGANHHAAAEGVTAATEVLDVLDVPVPETGRRVPPPVARHGLVVDRLAVSPGPDAPALPPVSLRVAPGEVIAVVGPSGAGKSTLLAALLGFAVPCSGGVRVGGVELSDVDPDLWRAQVAWVPQRATLLAGTIGDNVALGVADAADEEIRLALRRAAAADLDPALEVGEDGAGLSAGERARVALARAFLRAERGAALLLLDEPTAHLDGPTEAAVLAGLRELGPGRCVLHVAHGRAPIAAADRVVAVGTAEGAMSVAAAP